MKNYMLLLLAAVFLNNIQPSIVYNHCSPGYIHTTSDTTKARRHPQNKKNLSHLALTKEDRKNYILEIPDQKINPPHDTVEGMGSRSTFTRIAVKLSNKSKDTLKYYIMSCSWRDIYHIENKGLMVMQQACDNNFPVIRALAPHHTSVTYLPVIFLRKPIKGFYPYKIAMYLQKVVSDKSESIFEDRFTENYHQNMADYTIWSAPANLIIK